MNETFKFTFSVFASLILTSPAFADGHATQLEARAMALDAVSHIKKLGPAQAFKDFQNPDSRFHDRDLYVFVHDFKCNFLAHGANPKLVGRNIWKLKNPNGRYACQDIVNGVKGNNTTWTDYIFKNPRTGQLAWKRTFSIRLDDMIINVGAYLKEEESSEK